MSMSIEDIRMQLRSGAYTRLCVLYGDEGYRKAYYCEKIIGRAVAKGMESFNLHRFDADSFDLPVIIAAVENLPLMSDYKCVVLKDIDIDKMPAVQWKELTGMLRDIPAQCIVLIYFDSFTPDKRGSRLKSLLQLAEKVGTTAELNRMGTGDLKKWAGERIARRGCSINDATLSHLIETCGDDMTRLAAEIEKFCALADGGEIRRETVDALAVRPLNASIYDLARTITAGRTSRALEIVGDLFNQKEEPVIILSALSGAFCDLCRARTAVDAGAGLKELTADFNYKGKEFRARNALRDCRDCSPAFLRRCTELLFHADADLKGGRKDRRLVFERLIIEMALARGQ